MERKKVKYPIGEQSFQNLRKEGFLYVDKTEYIEKILDGSKYYFLGRPRRFGKSLFLSTLKSFFEGKRELFKGLYADTMDWNWEPHPVLYLDLNTSRYENSGMLADVLDRQLREWEETYEIDVKDTVPAQRLATIIRIAAQKTGKGVVILVDEYDKPLVNNISNREQFIGYRDELAALYSNFKSSADHIRLVFLTGVSRFGKLSVFSGLNNIRDISFLPQYAAICGITEQELKDYFQNGIHALAEENSRDIDEELAQLKRWYDGYHFSKKSPDIYNPFSILQAMDSSDYYNYWIASGTPSLLAEQLKRTDTQLDRLIHTNCSQNVLEGLDIDNISPISLFYQTGYLTIKSYDSESALFTLGIPNKEVKQGLFEFLLPYYSKVREDESRPFITELRKEMAEGRINDFMHRLQTLFAGLGYNMRFDEEKNVQNAFVIIFNLIGLYVDAEVRTSDGRIDILVRTADYLYIMELKYDGSAEEALNQIIEKEYSLPWSADRRRVTAIGINYSSTKRRIDSWSVKELPAGI